MDMKKKLASLLVLGFSTTLFAQGTIKKEKSTKKKKINVWMCTYAGRNPLNNIIIINLISKLIIIHVK